MTDQIPIKKPTRREALSAAKKQLICEKAFELFSAYGYEKTTLKEISDASGFSIGSLYNFFRTKESILLAIGHRLSDTAFDLEDIEKKVTEPEKWILEYMLIYSSGWEKMGIDLATQLVRVYDKAYLNPAEKSIRSSDTFRSLARYIAAAKEYGSICDPLSPEQIASYFITIGLGLLYEWCMFGGGYGLTEKAAWFLPRIIKTFVCDRD